MKTLYVICKIAGAEYAIPASDVMQMESYSPMTPVPGAPDFVAGLIQVRQQVVPVIDARLRFGIARAEPTPESRFVILNLGKRLVGVLVDSAREVRNLNVEDFSSATVLGAQTMGFVKAVAQIKERIILLFDVLKFAGEETKNG